MYIKQEKKAHNLRQFIVGHDLQLCNRMSQIIKIEMLYSIGAYQFFDQVFKTLYHFQFYLLNRNQIQNKFNKLEPSSLQSNRKVLGCSFESKEDCKLDYS